jgi:GTP cyclohydrolase III
MEQIRKAAAQLVDEMQRQGRSDALVYFLCGDNEFFHPLLEAMNVVDVIPEIEGDLSMAIVTISPEQLNLIGGV